MKIGWLGLGKLGAPIVSVLKSVHSVTAYDIDPALTQVATVADAVADAEVVCIAVQTPHDPRYEGVTIAPTDPRPFDLSYLQKAVIEVVAALKHRVVPIVIVSTVLPGDCRRAILPLLDGQYLVYNPAFVAMGTVEHDFLHPEFVLLGSDDIRGGWITERIYRALDIDLDTFTHTSIESAELIKVAYNTFISQKIVFTNALMEICEKVPHADIYDVTETLKKATTRVVSPRYMSPGMGDAGPCHPRDNIAMMWLAEQLDLSANPFEFVVRAREAQTRWIARLAVRKSVETGLPLVLLGKAYKAGVDIETGSCGLLLASILDEWGTDYTWDDTSALAVYVECLPGLADDVPQGSEIVSPWRTVGR